MRTTETLSRPTYSVGLGLMPMSWTVVAPAALKGSVKVCQLFVPIAVDVKPPVKVPAVEVTVAWIDDGRPKVDELPKSNDRV